jgi:uncharacterized repeat protein (TIGR01451 family)
MRLLVPLLAIVAVALAIGWSPGWPGGEEASADVPHAGLDFSLGSDLNSAPDGDPSNDDCDTRPETAGIPVKCTVPAGTTFVVKVYLNSLGSVTYQGIDIFATYSGITSKNNPDNADWPTCTFPAAIVTPGANRWGCAQGISAAASSYTGPVGKISYNCPPSVQTSGTVTLVHGASDTALDGEHAEGEGTTESLTINCTLPPTNTPTSTLSPTRTNTLPPSATSTRTPTATATATRTATSTPLPSEQADVEIIKTDLQDPIGANSLLTYRLTITNNGATKANGVTASDLLPDEVIFDSYVSGGATCIHDGSPTGGYVNCTIGSMVPSAQVIIDIVVITPEPTDDIRIGNVATVSATNEPFENRNNNQDAEQTVVLAPRADLIIDKVDKVDPVTSNAQITYNVHVENIGPGDAQNVLVYDNLEEGMVYKDGPSSPLCEEEVPPSVDPNGALTEVDIICSLGTVPSGGSVDFQIVANAPNAKQDVIVKNIAYVAGDNELFAQTGNNLTLEDTAVIAPPPDLSIVKTGPVSVKRTDYYSYKLAIQNNGGGHAFSVVVTDTLPKKQVGNLLLPVTVVSITGANCNQQGNVINCAILFIPGNGGSLSITLNVRAPTVLAQSNIVNNATINDADEPLDPPGNNSSSANTKITACFDVTGDKAVRIVDINALVERYGLGVGDPGYDLLYDLDGNGRILVADISIMVDHYGENCSNFPGP